MSFVNAAPDSVAVAATNLAQIGSALNTSNTAAMAPTTGVLAAGADDVSAAVAGIFGAHAQGYQAISAQMTSFQQQFVQQIGAGAAQYAATEAQNASPLQELQSMASSPVQALTGCPLIGSGANGLIGTGESGGNGDSAGLWGIGGNGGAGGVVAGGPVGEPVLAVGSGGNGGAGGWLGGGGGLAGAAGFSPGQNGGTGGNWGTPGFGGRLLGQVGTGGNAGEGGNGGRSGWLFGDAGAGGNIGTAGRWWPTPTSIPLPAPQAMPAR
jgi:hypothetical protein